MMWEFQVLAWDRHKNVAGLNWGYQPSGDCFVDISRMTISLNFLFTTLVENL
jgi:hypothetical protein